MTANIRCSDCTNLTNPSADWIYAALQGSPIQDDSQTASIKQHSDIYGTLSIDMTQAKGVPLYGAETNSGSSTTSSSSILRETVTATATTKSTPAPSTGLCTGTKLAMAIPLPVVFLLLLGGFVYWKRQQGGQQGNVGHSSIWKRFWGMTGRSQDHLDPIWEKAEIDGNEVKPSELDGIRIHELYDPPRVHQLNSSDRPAELQG